MIAARVVGASNGESLECPRQPAVVAEAQISGTSSGLAFELRTDTPIQLYDILPYGGAKTFVPAASLLYPVSAWGKDYMAITPHAEGTGWMIAVGSVDGTRVRVWPTAQPLPGTIADAAPNDFTEYLIDAGQALQWASSEEFRGSVVTADHPIAMLTGTAGLSVVTADVSLGDQDGSHQQIVWRAKSFTTRLPARPMSATLAGLHELRLATSVAARR